MPTFAVLHLQGSRLSVAYRVLVYL